MADRIQMKSPKLKRQWADHVKRWNDCTDCPLGRDAIKHVLLRGRLPCSVLFIGEAPGVSEDATGVPFIGQAGTLLEKMLALVTTKLGKPFSYAVANILACIPHQSDGTGFREPDPLEIKACSPRVLEVIQMAEPRLIITLGKIAGKNVKLPDKMKWAGKPPAMINSYHPSYILREGGVGSVVAKRFILELEMNVRNHVFSTKD